MAWTPLCILRPAEELTATSDERGQKLDVTESRVLRRRSVRGRDRVEANARLTASTAAVLLVLLAIEGATVPFVGPLLTAHVVVGMILVPPVLVKIGTTSYRFVRYYRGDPSFRQKGPPPDALRLLGPFVVALTVVLFASGIASLFVSGVWRSDALLLHKVSFVLWFGAMAIHVLGHLVDTARWAPRDWFGRSRRDIKGAGARQWLLALSVVVGVLLGALFAGRVSDFRAARRSAAVAPSAENTIREPGRTSVGHFAGWSLGEAVDPLVAYWGEDYVVRADIVTKSRAHQDSKNV